MAIVPRIRIACNECGRVVDDEKDLLWTPFYPVDDFLGIDRRKQGGNMFHFTCKCPDCGSSELFKY